MDNFFIIHIKNKFGIHKRKKGTEMNLNEFIFHEREELFIKYS